MTYFGFIFLSHAQLTESFCVAEDFKFAKRDSASKKLEEKYLLPLCVLLSECSAYVN
jgi:hypothetical protein